MKRRVVFSHSSPGHIRANGFLHPSDKHTQTHDTHEDMLTYFCLRGCGKPTLLKKERGRKERRGRGVEERRKQREGGSMTKNRKRRQSEFVAWYELEGLLSHMETPTNANSNITVGSMCDRWTHQQ